MEDKKPRKQWATLRNMSDEDRERFMFMYKNRHLYTVTAIADAFNVERHTVTKFARKLMAESGEQEGAA